MRLHRLHLVMPGLVPDIHVDTSQNGCKTYNPMYSKRFPLQEASRRGHPDVDARDKPWHDGEGVCLRSPGLSPAPMEQKFLGVALDAFRQRYRRRSRRPIGRAFEALQPSGPLRHLLQTGERVGLAVDVECLRLARGLAQFTPEVGDRLQTRRLRARPSPRGEPIVER